VKYIRRFNGTLINFFSSRVQAGVRKKISAQLGENHIAVQISSGEN
jgi:hypothetical protein